MLYDYICDDCGHIIEVMKKADDKPDIKCEKCEKPMRIKIGRVYSIRGKSESGGMSTSQTDLLRHQASIIAETQGGLQ